MNILRFLMLIQKVHNTPVNAISLFFCTAYIVSILSNRGGDKREKEGMVKCMLICGYTNTLRSKFGIGSQS